MISKLWQYGKYGILGGISGVLLISVDRVLIKHFLGINELGIYSAYSTASIMVAMQFSWIISNVLFPFASQEKSNYILLKKLDRLSLFSFLPCVFVLSIIGYVALSFFGKDYPINYLLIVSMSIYGTSHLIYLVYSSVISSGGPQWIFFSTRHSIIFGVIYLLSVSFLLPQIGIFAPATAFMLSMIYLIFIRYTLYSNPEFSKS